MAEVRMPKMGDGMVEGTILRWIKQEGDSVALDEPIAEIETDKANAEIPAEEAGVLSGIVVKEGETVPVGATIAHIGDVAQSPAGAARAATPAPAPGPPPDALRVPSLPEVPAPAAAAPAPSSPSPRGRVRASPLARTMAARMGLDIHGIPGTGGGVGRVVARDVVAARERSASVPPAVAPTPAPVAPSLDGQDAELSRMRRAIARRTVQSKQTVPHFYLTMPVEMDRAMTLLDEVNAASPEGKVTVNDLVVKACAAALARFPNVNASFTPDEKLRRFASVNIGIAVGTDDGLRIPVLTGCETRSLRAISAETKDLVARARAGTLTPQEMSGGTFSVSNLGMFGVEEFGAIINAPESAILAVGAVAPEACVDPDGGFVARRRMRVTLSCDHRAVDGLLGAKFLQEIRRVLENPISLLS
ncbi:MAG: 2-oxo acid dehydrogenase subunit E2 [Chthonomonadales bacterium]|nr:2-oxo acid dehydrogenase subunit E2 [Chthonomonadales bacterium]